MKKIFQLSKSKIKYISKLENRKILSLKGDKTFQ